MELVFFQLNSGAQSSQKIIYRYYTSGHYLYKKMLSTDLVQMHEILFFQTFSNFETLTT